jgi:orotate phosphoribosyltransferase
MFDYQKEFIAYSLDCDVLRFGDFLLKSGRVSPYFFNTGLFNTGLKLGKLGEFYAQALIQSSIAPDILYGPAYKGIPLVSATSIAYAKLTGRDMPYAFNRKEAKDHGEGGDLVGYGLEGKVMIVDDVITAGTSVRESVELILRKGAVPVGVLVALDRQEKVQSGLSAVQEVMECFKIPVVPIINLENIVDYIETNAARQLEAVVKYRQQYGV